FFEDVLERAALAADCVDCDLAVQQQAGEAGVKGRRVLDADVQKAIVGLQIKAEQDAGIEKFSGKFFRGVALDGKLFGSVFEIAADVLLIARGENATPVK